MAALHQLPVAESLSRQDSQDRIEGRKLSIKPRPAVLVQTCAVERLPDHANILRQLNRTFRRRSVNGRDKAAGTDVTLDQPRRELAQPQRNLQVRDSDVHGRIIPHRRAQHATDRSKPTALSGRGSAQ